MFDISKQANFVFEHAKAIRGSRLLESGPPPRPADERGPFFAGGGIRDCSGFVVVPLAKCANPSVISQCASLAELLSKEGVEEPTEWGRKYLPYSAYTLDEARIVQPKINWPAVRGSIEAMVTAFCPYFLAGANLGRRHRYPTPDHKIIPFTYHKVDIAAGWGCDVTLRTSGIYLGIDDPEPLCPSCEVRPIMGRDYLCEDCRFG